MDKRSSDESSDGNNNKGGNVLGGNQKVSQLVLEDENFDFYHNID